MVRAIWRTLCDMMLCDGLDHCRVIDYVNRIDDSRYVVLECSVVCRSVEDAGAGVLVKVEEDVSERIVIFVT